jgi:hypothetical protein
VASAAHPGFPLFWFSSELGQGPSSDMPLTARVSDPYIRGSTDQRDSDKHMTNPPPTVSQPAFGPWATGVIAGLVSAVLFASASTGTMLGTFVLFFLSPLPIGIAGLGWGWRAAGIASAAASLALGLGLGPRAGLVHAIAIGLPTIISAYYLLLNRLAGGTDVVSGAPLVEWYPLGRIVAAMALFAGVLSAISLLSLGTDIDSLKTAFRPVIERTFVAGIPKGSITPGPLTPARIEELTMLVITIAPISVAAVWFAFANLNLWLAALVTNKSERLSRPWSDLSLITLPRGLSLAFAGAVALALTGGMPGMLATSFATAILMAYLLVGLAIIHNVTRGSTIRPGILWAIYVLLFMLFLMAAPIIALVGMAEPILPWRRRANAPLSPPS